jgi:hypothetical protein
MVYGIRLASGEVQLIHEGSALTNVQVDGLLGGCAELVWVDELGMATAIDVLLHNVPDFDIEAVES